MRTTYLSEALDRLGNRASAERNEVLVDVVKQAREELKAIRKAAAVVAKWGIGDVCGPATREEWERDLEAAGEAERVFESIANGGA